MKLSMFLSWVVLIGPATSFVRQPTSKKTASKLNSVPNPLDTLTSGLASICRMPNGVTAAETPPTADGELDLLPKFTHLYDIENSADCRAVRELLTELDVVVEKVIPATPNSRVFIDSTSEFALPPAATIPRLEILESNGEAYIYCGKEEIVDYLTNLLEQQRQLAKDADDDSVLPTELDALKEKALQVWGLVGNELATLLRIGRGSRVSPAASVGPIDVPRPTKPLILYSYEGNQFCRLVREVLTELDIVYEVRSAGKESPRRSELAYITGGSSQCPYLVDPNTDVDMAESADIIAYLYKTYSRYTPPNEILEWASNTVLPLLKPIYKIVAPLQAGSNQADTAEHDSGMQQAREAVDQTIQNNPVVIYTFDLSPFCSEATALLDSLEISYVEVSLGKEWLPGLITPEGAQIRAALLEKTGQSSLPHIFVGGKSIGGLFSGTPGLVGSVEEGKLETMAETAAQILKKRKQIESGNTLQSF